MKVGLTTAQLNRLIELGASPAQLSEQFCDAGTCNRYFQKTEEALIRINREKLQTLVKSRRRPSLCSLEEALAASAQGRFSAGNNAGYSVREVFEQNDD